MRRLPSHVPLPGQIIGPLEAYCSEQFGWLQCSEIAHVFAELQRLRDAVVAALTPRSASEEASVRLTEYGSLLRAVSSRLSGKPLWAPPSSALRLQLPWLCTIFCPSGSNSSSNGGSLWGGKGTVASAVRTLCTLEEELCCCVFALAALQHNRAVLLQRAEGSHHKEAVSLFSRAASLFTLAESLAISAKTVSTDARAFAAFSLAHAQSVCYEVASRESMSLSFRSKLAAHASSLFAAAAAGLQEAQQRVSAEVSFMPSLQRSSKATEAAALEGWCKSQELCYAAVAHLQLALQQKEIAEAEGEGFGLLVARATLAEECLSRAEAASAAALARTPEAPRLQTAKLRVAVDALLKMAKRDNQLVYMEPVPKISALPPLEESSGLRGTTQVSLQDVLPPNRQAELQLSALLPAGVRALADEYQALFQGLTAQVNEEANGLLSRVATFLQKEQLPSALRSRLAAAQEAPQRQQRGQQHWCDEQGQVPPLQSNKGTNPDLHFQFSSTCSQELLSVQSLGGAQRLRQQQQMLEQLSASAGIHLATVQHQLQSQLQLLVQQRQQQQTSSTQDEFQVHEQQFLALECKTKELIECACLYATKLQQAQKANEMIGSRMYEALGPLKLLPCMATLQNDRISGTTVGLEKAFAQAPTLEQLLCATKKDAEQLVQKLLLRLHISVVDSTQHHPLLQQRLDAAHAALVELESRIYSLQEDQHKLCQSEHLIPEHVLQQLRQAAATSPDPAASVCTAATSASLREAARSTRKRIQEVVLQLEAAQQRWSELLAAESGEAELQKQKQHKLASELQQVVQQQASRLRKAFGEQQQGVAFYSQLQGFLQQLQQHQQQLLKDMNACIRSVHQQQKEHQEKLRALPKELQQEHINQINPLQAPQWPNAGTLSTRSGRSSIGSSDRSGSSTPAPANWRRYSCGPLVLPGSKPRRLSSADNSKNKHYCGAAAAAPERLPSFPSPDSTNGSSSSQQRCEEATENRNSINIAGASFALAHSPIRARNSRHSTSTTNRSFPDAPAAAPCSPRCTPQDTDTDTVFRGAEPLASLHATDHASNS